MEEQVMTAEEKQEMQKIFRLISLEKQQLIEVTNGITMQLLKIGQENQLFTAIQKNQSYLAKTLPWAHHHKSVQDAIDFINFIQQCHDDTTKLTYTIWENTQIIGSIAFQVLDLGLLSGEIGYWIDEDCSGRGIMTKCVKKMIEIGFSNYELKEILIKCAESNLKSAAIPQRFDFTEISKEIGAAENNGKKEDVRVFKLLRQDYFSQKTAKTINAVQQILE